LIRIGPLARCRSQGRKFIDQYEVEYRNPEELSVIRAAWLLSGIFVSTREREMPHIDDPDNLVVDGEEMSQTDFINKYCIGKEKVLTCSRVLDAAAKNFIDRTRGQRFDSTERQTN
jgi:hypothetical protein